MESSRCGRLLTLVTALVACSCHASFLLGRNSADGSTGVAGAGVPDAGVGGTPADGGTEAGAGGASGTPGTGGAPGPDGGAGGALYPSPKPVSFTLPRNFPAGGNPAALAIGDMNGDGLADLVLATDTGISTLLGNGDATFKAPLLDKMTGPATGVALGDVDGDGNLDAVVTIRMSAVAIRLGNGDGSFRLGVTYMIGPNVSSVALGDLDGDGKLDIAVTSNPINGSTATLTVFLIGATVSVGTTRSYEAGTAASAVVLGDLDGDGRLDVAVANTQPSPAPSTAPGGVLVFTNMGGGQLASPVAFANGIDANGLAAADLDGDGTIDLAFTRLSGGIDLLTNDGHGGFTDVPLKTGSPFGFAINANGSIVLPDIDGDGRPDPVALGGATSPFGNAVVQVAVRGSSGTENTIYPVYDPTSVVAADLDGDGLPELLVGNKIQQIPNDLANGGYVTVFENAQHGSFVNGGAANYGSNPFTSFAIGDVAFGDGRPDVVLTTANSVVIFPMGQGIEPEWLDPPLGAVSSVALGDLDRDGKVDVVEVIPDLGLVTVLGLSRVGIFINGTTPPTYPTGAGAMSVVLSDLNGDGALDIATANRGDGSVSALINRGDGTFLPSVRYPIGGTSKEIAVADLDGDGKPDLVAVLDESNSDANDLSILINNGEGSFAAARERVTGVQAQDVALGDLDGDGKVDFVVADGLDGGLAVMKGDGAGGFGAPVAYPSGMGSDGVQIIDVNGDGAPDVVAGSLSGSLSVLLNHGNGTFAATVDFGCGGPIRAFVAGDIDRDGKPDLYMSVTSLLPYLTYGHNTTP